MPIPIKVHKGYITKNDCAQQLLLGAEIQKRSLWCQIRPDFLILIGGLFQACFHTKSQQGTEASIQVSIETEKNGLASRPT